MNDREKLIDILAQKCRAEGEENGVPPCNKEYCDDNKKFCYGLVADTLLANGVTVQKHGRWEKKWHDNDLIGREYEECPVCGCMISDTEKFWDCNFCPNCGADMRGE